MTMRHFVELLRNGMVCDSSNGSLERVHLRPGADPSDIARVEFDRGLSLPRDYREFLECTNGCSLFGLDLCSVMDAEVHVEHRLWGFHNWGNGDFDCLRLGPGEVVVVFMNHGPDVTVKIATSFTDWLTRIVEEVQRYGNVLHPGDYRFAERRAGVYAHVLGALAGVDCELNG